MKKEQLMLRNITNDLRKVAYEQLSNVEEWRLALILSLVLIATGLGFLFSSIVPSVLVLPFSVPHIVAYAKERKKYKDREAALKAVLDRGNISISVETLSHVSEEEVYEPHYGLNGNRHSRKTIHVLYFMSGSSWRIPRVYNHYGWSKVYYISTTGLLNTAVQGNEYFYICLQGHHEVAYAYPCKFFELDEKLKSKKQ